MRLVRTTLILVALLGLAGSGCQSLFSPTPDTDSSPADDQVLTWDILPVGTSVDSVIFHIYINEVGFTNVQLHRIIADWEEMAVTWNSFGSAYDPAIAADFDANVVYDWKSVDITELAVDWMDGSHPNFGFAMAQSNPEFPRNRYASRENEGFEPYVELFTSDGNVEIILPVADAWVWEDDPDLNQGHNIKLYSGRNSETTGQKHALIHFELPDLPPDGGEGCTKTRRWWKRHSGHGNRPDEVTPLLPLWLGEPGGEKSIEVTDAHQAWQILRRRRGGCHPNGMTRLYAHMLATKLNVANGADDADVADALAAVDAFLSDHGRTDWWCMSRPEKQQARQWKRLFRRYNKGVIGPGRCE